MGRLGFILALLVLVGCKTAHDFVGSGPLVVSPQVTSYYRKDYLTKAGPSYFVVSRDGRWGGYTHCSNGINGCGGEGIIFSVLHRCEEQSGQSCHILDQWGSIVWKGRVAFNGEATPAYESDKAVCNVALTYRGRQPVWEARTKYVEYVREARKRGYTADTCFRLIYG